MRKTISIDLDDTLNEYFYHFDTYMKSKGYKWVKNKARDYPEIYGLTQNDFTSIITEFEKIDLLDHIKFVVIEPIRELSKRFDLVVMTARRDFLIEATIKSVNSTYPGMFKNVIFTRDKATKLLELGIKIHIDDSPSHVESCKSVGILGIQFKGISSRLPWATDDSLDWPEILELSKKW